jgi:hypothetical protein
MSMRWLTREWASGGLGEIEYEERWSSYLAHRNEVRPRLTRGADRLLDSIHLHDGQVRSFDYRPRHMLQVCVLIGDLQVGYEFVEMSYAEAELGLEAGVTISSLNLFGSDTEIIYDEVDTTSDGRFVHRVLLWPEGQYEVVFTAFADRRTPATPADRR